MISAATRFVYSSKDDPHCSLSSDVPPIDFLQANEYIQMQMLALDLASAFRNDLLDGRAQSRLLQTVYGTHPQFRVHSVFQGSTPATSHKFPLIPKNFTL